MTYSYSFRFSRAALFERKTLLMDTALMIASYTSSVVRPEAARSSVAFDVNDSAGDDEPLDFHKNVHPVSKPPLAIVAHRQIALYTPVRGRSIFRFPSLVIASSVVVRRCSRDLGGTLTVGCVGS